jgi:hypothetical protein
VLAAGFFPTDLTWYWGAVQSTPALALESLAVAAELLEESELELEPELEPELEAELVVDEELLEASPWAEAERFRFKVSAVTAQATVEARLINLLFICNWSYIL